MQQPINQIIQGFIDDFERNPYNSLWQRTKEEVRDLYLNDITHNNGAIISCNYQSTADHTNRHNIKDIGDALIAVKNNSDIPVVCNLSFQGEPTAIIHSFFVGPGQIEWIFAGCPLITSNMGFLIPILSFVDSDTGEPVVIDVTLYGICFLPERRRLNWTSGCKLGAEKFYQLIYGVNYRLYQSIDDFMIRDALLEPFYVFEAKPVLQCWDGTYVLK